MKFIKKIIALGIVSLGVFSSCEKDFASFNTNPESIIDVDPKTLFYTSQSKMLTSAYLWNDIYASKLRWMQYTSNIWGYSTTNFSYFSSSIGASLYQEYNSIGSYTTNIEYISDQTGQQEQYKGLINMSRILLIAKGIQTTDIHGSLAYTAAWKAREGDESSEALNPEFDNQEKLFTTWDGQLKEAITNLGSLSASNVNVGSYDRAYSGDPQKWIKAANALRLRIALRLWNRLPNQAIAIATEVLALSNTSSIPSSIDDSFILWHANDYTVYNGGDWHSIYDMDCASAPFMEYLKTYNDPRKTIFFLPNNLTAQNIAAYNAQTEDKKGFFTNSSGQNVYNITSGMTMWEGGTVSFDKRSFDEPYIARTLQGSPSINMRAMNYPQTKLWKGVGYDGSGTGGNFAPILTYADFCFMAAEFVLRANITSSSTAQQWYEKGVKNSVKDWYKIGDFAKVDNYQAITDEQINTFYNQPGVTWDNTKALEQIYCQAYVEHFKNTNESWAQWKRTGYPNKTTTIIKWDDVLINGVVQNVPRKVKFSYPAPGTVNYDHVKARLDEMASFPEFISVDNEFGKLWSEK